MMLPLSPPPNHGTYPEWLDPDCFPRPNQSGADDGARQPINRYDIAHYGARPYRKWRHSRNYWTSETQPFNAYEMKAMQITGACLVPPLIVVLSLTHDFLCILAGDLVSHLSHRVFLYHQIFCNYNHQGSMFFIFMRSYIFIQFLYFTRWRLEFCGGIKNYNRGGGQPPRCNVPSCAVDSLA